MFHYRLPQAYLSDPAWSIMPDWERWLSVERLAMNPDVLTGTGRPPQADICRNRHHPLSWTTGAWSDSRQARAHEGCAFVGGSLAMILGDNRINKV